MFKDSQRSRARLIAVTVLSLLLSSLALAAPAPIQLGADSFRWLDSAEYLRLQEPMELAQVRQQSFQPFGRDQVNQGISADYHWLHFYLDNPAPEAADWILRSETSYLDEVTIFFRQQPEAEFQELKLSDRSHFQSRPIDYRTLSWQGRTPGLGRTEVYLLAHNSKPDSVSLRFGIHHPDHFAELVREENLLLGAFYGSMMLMILLAFLVAALLRQANAFKYGMMLSSTLLLWLMLNGYGFQYLWPNNPYWHNEGFHLSFLLFVFASLEFSRSFLRLADLAPVWNRVFVGIQVFATAAALLRLAGAYESVLHVAFLLMSTVGLLIMAASWVAYRRGLDYALWSCVAWGVYASGLQLGVLSAYTDKLQWGMDALFFTQAGSLIETMFLSVAMAKWLVAMESDRKLAHAMALEDALTGLGNRRRLQSAFEELALQTNRHREAVYLLMIDIDHFKQINDSYGHDAGDKVLRVLGQLLRRMCRKGDLGVRFGGEEFAVLVGAGDAAAAMQIAERIRLDFASQPTPYGDHLIVHTLCCGIAEVASPRTQLNASEMMKRADAALYQAKQAGRNQSHVYTPETALQPRPFANASETEVLAAD